MLDDWVTKLSHDLGVKPDDAAISEILDLARDAAHAVARPAAPITTFIVGYAAGMRGGGRETIAQTVREALASIAAELPPAEPTVNGNGASHGYGAISGSTVQTGSAQSGAALAGAAQSEAAPSGAVPAEAAPPEAIPPDGVSAGQ